MCHDCVMRSGGVSVSVVIPTHNAASTLGAQLAAVLGQVIDRSVEVIVVDNASSDDPASVVNAHSQGSFPVRTVTAAEGSGVAYARNVGTAEAKGEVVVYCDADDVVRPGWLQAMAQALDADDIAGGVLDVTAINSPQVQAMSWHPEIAELPTTMRFLPYATGASMGVRRAVWVDMGGFDESYIGGHEEVDFAWRAQLKGYTVGFAPTAVIDYRLRTSVRAVMRQRFGYGRSYAQLYSRFREQPIRRLSLKHEVKVVVGFLSSAPKELVAGRFPAWLAGLAWISGRWRGNIAYRVRCPL